jgi:hypothetical protein
MRIECLRSGWCCKKGACPFGEMLPDNSQCKHLEGDQVGEYSCGIYDEILAGMPANRADIAPAFGAGCCATLNNDRIQKLGYVPFNLERD